MVLQRLQGFNLVEIHAFQLNRLLSHGERARRKVLRISSPGLLAAFGGQFAASEAVFDRNSVPEPGTRNTDR
jgi:hypothetical protein